MPGPRQNLTPDEVILNLQNQINCLNYELNQKDQAIALENSTNQALEADQALATQKSLDLENENRKMNDTIQKGTNVVKLMQDQNSQLKLNVDNAESQHRTKRARNLQNLENLIANPAKKMRLEPVNAAPSFSASIPQSLQATSSFQALVQPLVS